MWIVILLGFAFLIVFVCLLMVQYKGLIVAGEIFTYRSEADSAFPELRTKLEVIEVKDGWVKYRFLGQKSEFADRVEAFNARAVKI